MCIDIVLESPFHRGNVERNKERQSSMSHLQDIDCIVYFNDIRMVYNKQQPTFADSHDGIAILSFPDFFNFEWGIFKGCTWPAGCYRSLLLR